MQSVGPLLAQLKQVTELQNELIIRATEAFQQFITQSANATQVSHNPSSDGMQGSPRPREYETIYTNNIIHQSQHVVHEDVNKVNVSSIKGGIVDVKDMKYVRERFKKDIDFELYYLFEEKSIESIMILSDLFHCHSLSDDVKSTYHINELLRKCNTLHEVCEQFIVGDAVFTESSDDKKNMDTRETMGTHACGKIHKLQTTIPQELCDVMGRKFTESGLHGSNFLLKLEKAAEEMQCFEKEQIRYPHSLPRCHVTKSKSFTKDHMAVNPEDGFLSDSESQRALCSNIIPSTFENDENSISESTGTEFIYKFPDNQGISCSDSKPPNKEVPDDVSQYCPTSTSPDIEISDNSSQYSFDSEAPNSQEFNGFFPTSVPSDSEISDSEYSSQYSYDSEIPDSEYLSQYSCDSYLPDINESEGASLPTRDPPECKVPENASKYFCDGRKFADIEVLPDCRSHKDASRTLHWKAESNARRNSCPANITNMEIHHSHHLNESGYTYSPSMQCSSTKRINSDHAGNKRGSIMLPVPPVQSATVSMCDHREHKERIKEAINLLQTQCYMTFIEQQILPRISLDKISLSSDVHLAYLFLAALAFFKESKHAKSLHYLKQCVTLSQKYSTATKGYEALCYSYIGDIALMQEKPEEAYEQYKKAKVILHKYMTHISEEVIIVFLPSKSNLWIKYGTALMYIKGKGEKAKEAFKRALELNPTTVDRLTTYFSLGKLYKRDKECTNAIVEYQNYLKLAEEEDDFSAQITGHGDLGWIWLRLHHKETAFHHFLVALKLANDHFQTFIIAQVHEQCGNAYRSVGDMKEAERHYSMSLQHDDSNKVRREIILIAIGDIQVGHKSYKEAIKCYTEVETVKSCHMKFYLYKQRAYAYYMLAEQDKITVLTTGQAFNTYGPHYEIKSIPDTTKGLYQDAMTDCHNALRSLEKKKTKIKDKIFSSESIVKILHVLINCHVSLGEYEEALLLAHVSRATCFKELVKRYISPPSTSEVHSIVVTQSSPVLYLSCTGERLLGWVLCPTSGESVAILNMFEILLNECSMILERENVDTLQNMATEERHRHLKIMYDMIARPTMMILKDQKNEAKKIIIIPDEYTQSLPFGDFLHMCEDESDHWKWGVEICIKMMDFKMCSRRTNAHAKTVSEHKSLQDQELFYCFPSFPDSGKEPSEEDLFNFTVSTTNKHHDQVTEYAMETKVLNASVLHVPTMSNMKKILVTLQKVMKSNPEKFVFINQYSLETPEVLKVLLDSGTQAIVSLQCQAPENWTGLFMHLFYQFIIEGMELSEAVQRTNLSKQLMGNDDSWDYWHIGNFRFTTPASSAALTSALSCQLASHSIFPQLSAVKYLEDCDVKVIVK